VCVCARARARVCVCVCVCPEYYFKNATSLSSKLFYDIVLISFNKKKFLDYEHQGTGTNFLTIK